MNEAETVAINIHKAGDVVMCPYCGERTEVVELGAHFEFAPGETGITGRAWCDHPRAARRNATGGWRLVFVRESPRELAAVEKEAEE